MAVDKQDLLLKKNLYLRINKSFCKKIVLNFFAKLSAKSYAYQKFSHITHFMDSLWVPEC